MSLRLAERVASKSVFNQHRLGAVIAKAGRVISTGFNEIRYDKLIKQSTRHAEEAAIVKAIRQGSADSLRGSSLYVARLTPAGRTGLACPCERCNRLIASVGIRNVYFTVD